MGPTHAASGAVAGLGIAVLLPESYGGATSFGAACIYGGVAAGAALLPDFDHHNSTVTNSGGTVTAVVHRGVDAASVAIRNATSTTRDARSKDGHRGVTHTLIFAAAFSRLTWQLSQFQWGAAAVIFLTLWWSVLGLAGRWADHNPIRSVAIPAGIAASAFWMPGLTAPTGLGVAVLVGLVMHCIGDALTSSGAPWFAPLIPFNGRRWWNFRLPKPLTIEANGVGNAVLFCVFSSATLVIPVCLSPLIAPTLYQEWAWPPLAVAAAWDWW